MFTINRINTSSITEQVAEKIRTAIVSGEYEPGSNLSESNLSQYFKVSRTPIREALKQLEREGLVEIIPRVGTCVKKPTEKEITELFAIKEVLEGLAAGQLAESKNKKIIKKLEKNIMDMQQAIADNNNHLYVEANNEFHNNIIDGANNSKLKNMISLLINQIPYHQYVHMTIKAPNRIEKSLDEHRIILEKIKAGVAKEAEEAMRNHVKASEEKLIERIKERLSLIKN